MRFLDILAITIAAMLISGCGGGDDDGGGSGPDKSPTLNAANPTASVTADTNSYVNSIDVGISIANAPNSTFYYGYTYERSAIVTAQVTWNDDSSTPALDGNVKMYLHGPGVMGAGKYTDKVTIKVCEDEQCTRPFNGSPKVITVNYTVTGNPIPSGTFYGISELIDIESPSTATAAPAKVEVKAFGLPPYGFYVGATSRQYGIVSNFDFHSVSPKDESFSNFVGELAVGLPPPNQLGPGFYQDEILFSICYDRECTKPARGSPWTIPVRYAVSAAAGREFQQRIVALNGRPLAMVGDPTGDNLFVATERYSGTNVSYHLFKLNPVSGAILISREIGREVEMMSVSGDGQYLYLTTAPSWVPSLQSTVQRFRTADLISDVELTLPNQFDHSSIANLQASPQDPRAVAVGYWYTDATVSEKRVVIFDDATARPSTASANEYGLWWTPDGATLYLGGTSSIVAMPVTAAGVSTPTQLATLLPGDGFYDTYRLHGVEHYLYSVLGGVFDTVTRSVIGRYEFKTRTPQTSAQTYANILPDAASNRTFAVYQDPARPLVLNADMRTLQAFHRTTFQPLWFARLPVDGSPVRWGADGLALMSWDSQNNAGSVYLINGSYLLNSPLPPLSNSSSAVYKTSMRWQAR